MSGRWVEQLRTLLHWALGFRYIKFGIVGASGTVVNVTVLWLAQEHLLQSLAAPQERLKYSLALAIAIATVSNFSLNRLWTWADRKPGVTPDKVGVLGLFVRYATASWLGMALQFGITLWLARFIPYPLANIMAIVVASISNFLANDKWTFKAKT